MLIRYNWPEDLKRVNDYLLTLTSPHDVNIATPKRTIPQNSLIHNNIWIIAKHTGYTIDEAKIILKDWITELGRLKMKYTREVKGKQKEFYRSSKDLDTKELSLFNDYICEVWEALKLQMCYPDLVWYAKELFNN